MQPLSEEQLALMKTLQDDDGLIEPSAVIAAARPADSVLHPCFEWDLQAAAERDWLNTAKTLIRFVRLEVVIEHSTVLAPYYVVDPTRPPRSQRYVELTRARMDVEMAE